MSDKRTLVTIEETTIWDGVDVTPVIPEGYYPYIQMAKELLKMSIRDASNAFGQHKLTKSGKEAIDWLFYSDGSLPWSFEWAVDLVSLSTGIQCSAVQSRLNLLRNIDILAAKKEFDQRSTSVRSLSPELAAACN